MLNFIDSLLLPGQFIPHGHCYLWKPDLVWLHILADGLTALAYYSIPVTLLYFVQRRRDLPFHWVFLLFGAFIVACGTTHVMEIWTLWHPDYWVSGSVKAITASVSLYTAVTLIPLVPQALSLPSPAQLEAANQALAHQVEAREQAEAEVRSLNAVLEQRIAERTQQLEAANQMMEELLERERTARSEAESTNRLKDEFLATLSHELRTPLNAVLGWSQLLRSRQFPPETAQKAMETIERNTRSLARMIEDLLDVSRIIRGKLRLSVAPVELTTVIEAAVETMRPAADAKDIRFNVHLDCNVSSIAGDAGRLQQVVWNLTSNAVKFTGQGGQVDVYLEAIDGDAQIRVADTGQGIQPDFLPHVFEHFRQADSTTTRSQSGLGLGLAIVRHLVELHGGTVQARSAGLEQGATFIVRLPRSTRRLEHSPDTGIQTAPSQAGMAQLAASEHALQGLQILVVDDEASAQDFMAVMLKEHGANVVAVGSAREAFTVFQDWSPDVLVSDVGMPDEDGYTLIRRIRQLETNQTNANDGVHGILAIAVTAYTRPQDQAQALAAGFQRHLSKPLNSTALLSTILELVRSRSELSSSSSHR